MFRVVILFFLFFKFFYSENIITSNGILKLSYSLENNRIENIDRMLDKNRFIKYIDEGIIYNNKFYSPEETTAYYLERTNIIKIEKAYSIGVITESYIYFSDKRNLIYIETRIKKDPLESFYMCYKIKPEKEIGRLELYEKYYKFDDLYFSLSSKNTIYFASDYDLRNLKLSPLGEKQIKEYGKDLVILTKSSVIKNKIIIASNKIETDYFDYTVSDEINNWEKWLGTKKDELVIQNLILLKMLQNKDGSIVSYNKLEPNLEARNMLYAAEAFLDWGYFSETERILNYLLSMNKKYYKEDYLISNFAYDSDRNETILQDKFGLVKSYYNSALFLYVFSKYINQVNNKEFLEVNFKLINDKVYIYILSLIEESDVISDSGKTNKGMHDSYLETYLMIYRGLSEYLELLKKYKLDNSTEETLNKIERLRLNFIKYYLKSENLKISIKNSNIAKLDQTYYLNKEIIGSNEKFKIYVRNLVREYWNDKQLSLSEEIEFNKKLLEIDYSNTFRNRIKELESKIKLMNRIGLNEYGEFDIEAASRYLILKAYSEEK